MPVVNHVRFGYYYDEYYHYLYGLGIKDVCIKLAICLIFIFFQ